MNDEKVVSFPHLGEYHHVFTYLFKKLTKAKVLPPPPITKKTIELGSKYAPDFVCVPFKYNLGNFLESLENGANILVQAGGGCRYGYYAEVQEQILKDLGYHFKFYSLTGKDVSIRRVYHMMKQINKHLSFIKFSHYFLMAFIMIQLFDNIDEYIRENIGFEVKTNSFIDLKKETEEHFTKCNNPITLLWNYYKYKKAFLRLPIKKKENCMKIGIIGELYTAMEPQASYELEKTLAKMHIEIKRFTNVSYLLFWKRWKTKKMLKEVKDYCKYTIGADGLDNIYRTKWLIDHNFDGIIHTKPFGCTPEIGAIHIIQKVCSDYQMPIIYFSFDNQTSQEGIKTRLEAFYDMLEMKKGRKNEKSISRN